MEKSAIRKTVDKLSNICGVKKCYKNKNLNKKLCVNVVKPVKSTKMAIVPPLQSSKPSIVMQVSCLDSSLSSSAVPSNSSHQPRKRERCYLKNCMSTQRDIQFYNGPEALAPGKQSSSRRSCESFTASSMNNSFGKKKMKPGTTSPASPSNSSRHLSTKEHSPPKKVSFKVKNINVLCHKSETKATSTHCHKEEAKKDSRKSKAAMKQRWEGEREHVGDLPRLKEIESAIGTTSPLSKPSSSNLVECQSAFPDKCGNNQVQPNEKSDSPKPKKKKKKNRRKKSTSPTANSDLESRHTSHILSNGSFKGKQKMKKKIEKAARNFISLKQKFSQKLPSGNFRLDAAQNQLLANITPLKQDPSIDFCDDVEMSDVSVSLPSLDVLSDMHVDIPSNDTKSCYIVLDTNILISQLKFVDELKDLPVEGMGPSHIFIPWVVIQELDRMKSRTGRTRVRVGEAVKYIYTMLNSKHPRFHGQSAKMAALCLKSYDECNDDSILGCCIQLQETMGKERVILLTDDKNLCNKALISDVKTYTMESLLEKLKQRISHLISDANGPVLVNEEPPKQKMSCPNDQKELDYIICEAKALLRCFLEPYFKEAIMEAFGDLGHRFLLPTSSTLNDILDHFKKYWKSVFGCVLPNSLLSQFEKLSKEFSLTAGYISDVSQALSTLSSMEVICSSMLSLSPKCQADLDASLYRIHSLLDQVKAIQENNAECREPVKSDDASRNSQVVLGVFHHIWDLMNHLCGMIMDFVGKPHEFVYTKPDVLPTKSDFQNIIPSLYPGMHQIKKAFSRVLNSTADKGESDVRRLYDFLVHFVPSLKIQVAQPPLERFSVAALMQFCYNPENGEILQSGFQQLANFFAKLDECIHNPIWKS